MQVRPLKVKEIATLSPHMKEKMTQTESMTIIVEAVPILSEIIKDIEGLTIDDKPISVQTLCEEIVFFSLVWSILRYVIKISSMDEEEEKNSKGQSDTTS